MELCVRKLGKIGYDNALNLQEQLAAARKNDLIPDQLLFLQHDPVITMGRRAQPENILVSADFLEQEGIIVRRTNRGGDAAYHGPGQLVGYLILKLPPAAGLRRLVWNIEESLNILLGSYEVQAERKSGYPGLWIGEAKIAAVGLAVREGVTMHGFALNVSPRLEHFDLINQCGLGKGVTSMSMTGVEVTDWAELERGMEASWRDVFHRFPLAG
jgi:lipoate-protein ligase B